MPLQPLLPQRGSRHLILSVPARTRGGDVSGESARASKRAEGERGREQARRRCQQNKFCGLGGVGQHSPLEPGDKVALTDTSGERKKKKEREKSRSVLV